VVFDAIVGQETGKVRVADKTKILWVSPENQVSSRFWQDLQISFPRDSLTELAWRKIPPLVWEGG